MAEMVKTAKKDVKLKGIPILSPDGHTIAQERQEDIDRIEAYVVRVEGLANLMDSQFNIPGMPINLGLDTIIGFIPGIGDTIGLAISAYIISQAARVGVSREDISKMILNVGLDWLVGLVPIIGDLFDWGWKANNRNVALLRTHWDAIKPTPMIDVTEMAAKLNS